MLGLIAHKIRNSSVEYKYFGEFESGENMAGNVFLFPVDLFSQTTGEQ